MPNKPVHCEDCRCEISKISHERSIKRFGVPLCWKCARMKITLPEEELEMILNDPNGLLALATAMCGSSMIILKAY